MFDLNYIYISNMKIKVLNFYLLFFLLLNSIVNKYIQTTTSTPTKRKKRREEDECVDRFVWKKNKTQEQINNKSTIYEYNFECIAILFNGNLMKNRNEDEMRQIKWTLK